MRCGIPASHFPGTLIAAVKQIPLGPAHADEESPTSLVHKIISLTKLKPTGSVGRRRAFLSPASAWAPGAILVSGEHMERC